MTEEPAHRLVRVAYDAVAGDYLARFRDELAHKPLDRALLRLLVEEAPAGTPVADLGCGPGHVAGWLAGTGARVVGVDLAPAMVEVGRRSFPDVEFRCGDLLALPATDGEFGAALALYSIIHLQAGELDAAFAEIRRVLRPSSLLLVAFHIGHETRHLSDWFGHEVELDFRFFETGTVREALESAGLSVEATVERRHLPEEAETRRGYILARAV
ncbi:MAG: class I SAM-dependent methyltransferase [Acidobacteriota bacterium]|nr:class I SAM-dependent methyltransferase [Acidobacteriota bacterium]